MAEPYGKLVCGKNQVTVLSAYHRRSTSIDIRPYPLSSTFAYSLTLNVSLLRLYFLAFTTQRNTSKMTGLVLVSQSVVVHMSEKRLTIDN